MYVEVERRRLSGEIADGQAYVVPDVSVGSLCGS